MNALLFLLVLSFQVMFPIPEKYDPIPLLNQIQYPFTESECNYDIPFINLDKFGVHCGYVSVPENYDDPNSPNIKIAVVIIPGQAEEIHPDPLFIAQGGPGGSTIETYLEYILSQGGFVTDRDTILFDQRGTFYSYPSLICPEIHQLVIDTIEKNLSEEEINNLELEALRKCHKRLINNDINLSAYNSLDNASDIAAIRDALGYDKINLYGVSYGTLLALHTMSHHPEIIRSAILDAVVPPQNNFILDAPKSMDRAFKQLFQSCKSIQDCNRFYPDLESQYKEVIDQLEKNPATVSMTDLETGKTYDAIVDGMTFQWGLFQMLYATSLIPTLPRMIDDASAGNFDFFGKIMSVFIFDRSTSYGMYYSVLCAEESDFVLSDYDLSGVDPTIIAMEDGSAKFFLDACDIWDVAALPETVNSPVISTIPTLILSGEFDPITPPLYGDIASKTLERSYHIQFPSGGHGQALEGKCQDQIIRDFIADPHNPPSTQCIQNIQSPDYITPKNTIDIPQLERFLYPDSSVIFEIVGYLCSLAYLSSTILVIPLSWIVLKLQQEKKRKMSYDGVAAPELVDASQIANQPTQVTKPDQQDISPIPMRFAGLIAILTSLVNLIFNFGFIAIAIYMIFNNDNRLFFGFMADSKYLFALPLIILIMSVLLMICIIQAWMHKEWGLLKKLYYSTITGAASVCIIILINWGFLNLLF